MSDTFTNYSTNVFNKLNKSIIDKLKVLDNKQIHLIITELIQFETDFDDIDKDMDQYINKMVSVQINKELNKDIAKFNIKQINNKLYLLAKNT